jgi:hypothetical protein
MPTWAELQSEVYTWTNRPTQIAETTLALKSAIRTVHKSGKFWRDLTKQNTGTLTLAALQPVSLTALSPRFRQMAYVKSTVQDLYLDPVTIDDQLDHNRLQRQNIYYGMGAEIMVRAANPEEAYECAFYTYPDMAFVTNGTSSTDWIYNDFQDLVVLWAASTILATIGEQEIKSRVDQLAAIMFADLIQDNLEVVGR